MNNELIAMTTGYIEDLLSKENSIICLLDENIDLCDNKYLKHSGDIISTYDNRKANFLLLLEVLKKYLSNINENKTNNNISYLLDILTASYMESTHHTNGFFIDFIDLCPVLDLFPFEHKFCNYASFLEFKEFINTFGIECLPVDLLTNVTNCEMDDIESYCEYLKEEYDDSYYYFSFNIHSDSIDSFLSKNITDVLKMNNFKEYLLDIHRYIIPCYSTVSDVIITKNIVSKESNKSAYSVKIGSSEPIDCYTETASYSKLKDLKVLLDDFEDFIINNI